MLNNITVTEEDIYYKNDVPRNGAKVAKLSTFQVFKPKTDQIRAKLRENAVSTAPTSTETEVKHESTPVATETPKAAETTNELPLTSEEVLKAKSSSLGIIAYKELAGNIVPFESIQVVSRRLKTNPVVPGNTNRERNVNGTVMILETEINKTPETPVEQPQTFDFSSVSGLNNISTDKVEEPAIETNTYDNNSKLDEWLSKETGTTSDTTGNDAILNEVNELQAKRNDNVNTLANQREILEALRARIANNEALVSARKRELEEENMNLTRELNDVLAEINQLTNLANEQEAFLGISNDDDGMGKGMAA